jgi:hypothetical protein
MIEACSRSGRSTENGGVPRQESTPPAQTQDLLTVRTGRPGGAPTGRAKRIEPGEDDNVRRSLEMENSGAVVLADRAYRIQQSPSAADVARARLESGDVGDTNKEPDYLLEGRVFDCYSPVNPAKNARGIHSEAKKKVEEGQTQRVVVNLESWRGDMSALEKQFAEWPVPGLKEVKVITQDGDIVQIDLPPYRPMEQYPWLPNTR